MELDLNVSNAIKAQAQFHWMEALVIHCWSIQTLDRHRGICTLLQEGF